MIGNPVSFPRVKYLAEKYVQVAGEKSFQIVQVSEQQIIEAMLAANRHGHIACTQGGECLAGLKNALAQGLIGAGEKAILDSTAHSLKFSGFQEKYFNDSFEPEYEIKPDPALANRPEELLANVEAASLPVDELAARGADAVANRLNLIEIESEK